MSLSLILIPAEIRRLKKMVERRGSKGIFCYKTGISRSTLWIILKTGEMDSTVYEKIKPITGDLTFQHE